MNAMYYRHVFWNWVANLGLSNNRYNAILILLDLMLPDLYPTYSDDTAD